MNVSANYAIGAVVYRSLFLSSMAEYSKSNNYA